MVACGLVLLMSCQKEKQNAVPNGMIQLTMEGYGDVSTKTSTSGNTVAWVNGDEVYFYVGSYETKQSREVTVSDGKAYITSVLSGSGEIRGFYPDIYQFNPEGTTVYVSFSDSYTCSYDANGRQIIALPMVAVASSGSNTIQFKHISAAVKVTVMNGIGDGLVIDNVCVSSTTSRLGLSAQLDMSDEENFGVTRAAGSGFVRVILSGVTLANNATKEVQVPILPVNADENLTITINSHIGDIKYIYQHTASVPQALTRNKMLTANCKIHTGEGNHVSVVDAPSGAIGGLFSVSSTKKVYFSQGNLQATYYDDNWDDETPGTWSWAFATNQWDVIGGRSNGGSSPQTGNNYINGNGTMSANGTVDLFGWVGASSSLTGAAQYGISNSTTSSDYGTSTTENLKSDWGNTIGDGWRTLSYAEWDYLMNTRTGSTTPRGDNIRFQKAIINNVNVNDLDGNWGWIIFPDGEFFSFDEAKNWWENGGDYVVCSSAQWEAFVAKGCVFLPQAGYRTNGYTPPAVFGGDQAYWTSSSNSEAGSEHARLMLFEGNNWVSFDQAAADYRQRGYSVRLVKDAN